MFVGVLLAHPQATVAEKEMTTKLKQLAPNQVIEDARQPVLREFRQVPGVGKSIAEDLWNLGLRAVSDLKNQDPEDLYLRLCAFQGTHVDRCMLYVFRCAVYYASNDIHDPELLKWWNWKDANPKYEPVKRSTKVENR
ncbi:MAG TPA: helix-hairpin-helix domain-containing protein [Ktedonobacteraceae bacterium]